MATSLLSAVGTDTFQGLSGYKRPLQSNPTRVPSNLPSFRGVPNQPGKDIRAPAIKSSANHPDRKTNVTIPYARVTPVETPSDIGRLNEGDVAFCSKTRPGIPGYAHARMTRLAGVDALNRWQGPDNWAMKTEDGTYRYILPEGRVVGDDWRNVPFLGEWALDGIVMSSDEKDSYYSKTRDGNLYNIAIEGPAMVNNGFLDSTLAPNQLTPYNQGQMSRFKQPLGSSYMDHRIEQRGAAKLHAEQEFDFRADYSGEHYHLYPLQSFDREVRPMNELYCGLVATEYKMNKSIAKKLEKITKAYKDAEELKEAKLAEFRTADSKYRSALSRPADPNDPNDPRISEKRLAAEAANTNLEILRGDLNRALAEMAQLETILPPAGQRDSIQEAGFNKIEALVDERSAAVNAALGESKTAQEQYDTAVATLTPARLDVDAIRAEFAKADKLTEKHKDGVKAKTAYQKMGWWDETKSARTADSPASFAAFRWVFFTSQQAWAMEALDEGLLPGEPRGAAKRQKTIDPYNNGALRRYDFRRMVGAYYIGKVIDCKAGKMPFMEGGPRDTGFRVTANVNIEWRDWRALRRIFNSPDSKLQFGEVLTGCPKWTKDTKDAEKNRLFQWPTRFVPDFTGDRKDNPNFPIEVDFLYKADQSKLREMDYAKEIADRKARAPKSTKAPRADPEPVLPKVEELDDGADDEDELLPNPGDPGQEDDNDDDDDQLVLEENEEPAGGGDAGAGEEPDGDDDGSFEPGRDPNNPFSLLPDETLSTLEPHLKAALLRHKKRNLVDAVVEARYKNAPELPALPAAPTAEHFAHRASVASHRLSLLTAPVTYGEARAFLKGAPVSSVARFVQAPPAAPPAPAAAAASSSSAPASAASVASATAASAASAASAAPAAAVPVIQAPSAPGKKRRAGNTDVFSGIFGGGEEAPQPLNPAHRSDGGGGSGSTGRSFQRRGKGAGK